jgi:hypothetical protein
MAKLTRAPRAQAPAKGDDDILSTDAPKGPAKAQLRATLVQCNELARKARMAQEKEEQELTRFVSATMAKRRAERGE